MIATHAKRDEPVAAAHDDRLDRLFRIDFQECADFVDRLLRRRPDALERSGGRGTLRRRRNRFGHLDVRGVIGFGRIRDRILAGIGEHLELVARIAADRAGVGLHGAERQAEPREDARVRVVHVAVFGVERGRVGVERIRVLHQELARAHDAEARADLVAELHLDLVEVDRQLLVALELRAREVGDDFLVRRAVAVPGVLAILDLEELSAKLLPAAGFVPELLRLHRRHQELYRAGAVHFLAHDRLDLAQHAKAERAPRVDAGRELAQHAGADHELVARNLGVGRHFLDGREVETRKTHGISIRSGAADSSSAHMFVVPAKAGTQWLDSERNAEGWIPAFAGMTGYRALGTTFVFGS